MNIDHDYIRIDTAKTSKDLLAVWKLTHDTYVREGYADPTPDGLFRHYPHLDVAKETTVFIARNEFGEIVGTNSLTMDGSNGLPMDEDFPEEMPLIRKVCADNNLRLCACWRLATSVGYRNNLDVMMKLITATVNLGIKNQGDVSLYTINPKHVSFYTRMLGLSKAVEEVRTSHSVKGNPAVLMKGHSSELIKRWEEVKERRVSAKLNKVKVA